MNALDFEFKEMTKFKKPGVVVYRFELYDEPSDNYLPVVYDQCFNIYKLLKDQCYEKGTYYVNPGRLLSYGKIK